MAHVLLRLVGGLCRAWSLGLGDPLAGGKGSFVARVRMENGAYAVLKVAPPAVDFARLAGTMVLADGAGYVRLYRVDPRRYALLMKPLGPRSCGCPGRWSSNSTRWPRMLLVRRVSMLGQTLAPRPPMLAAAALRIRIAVLTYLVTIVGYACVLVFVIRPLGETALLGTAAGIGVGCLLIGVMRRRGELARQRNRELQADLARLALTDPLTSLANRRAFEAFLGDHLSHSDEDEVVLLALDIDHFKHVNDRLSHQAGDDVLARVAHVPASEAGEDEIGARTGVKSSRRRRLTALRRRRWHGPSRSAQPWRPPWTSSRCR